MRFPFRRRRRDVSAAERYATATQLQLTWWRFRRHRLAMVSLVVLMLAYGMAIMADFLATTDPHATDARTSYIAPQPIHWCDDDGSFRPYIYGQKGVRDIRTFKLIYTLDTSRKVYVELFGHNYPWSLLGMRSDVHLLGLKNPRQGDGIYLLGTDQLGRDLWSRLMVATRVSLFIGLIGVSISLFLGVILGGISAIYGGWIDLLIQRMIEVIRSMPTIPLWLGLAAALPNTWSVTQIYFAITMIISLLAWTDLARVVRGKFLALQEEDFVLGGGTGGRLAGADHFPAHAAVLRQPHHRRGQPRAAGDDHQRDIAELPRPRPAAAGDLLGRPAAGRAERADAGAAPWLLSAAGPVITGDPGLQFPRRRAARRGRSLWLSRSSRCAICRPFHTQKAPSAPWTGRLRRVQGRTLGRGRRERLRQERGRAERFWESSSVRAGRSREDPAARRAGSEVTGNWRPTAPPSRDPRRRSPGVPGADGLVQPGLHDRQPDHGGDPAAHAPRLRRAARRARSRCSTWSASPQPSRRCRRISVPAFRRACASAS